jgi:hypothetical protein
MKPLSKRYTNRFKLSMNDGYNPHGYIMYTIIDTVTDELIVSAVDNNYRSHSWYEYLTQLMNEDDYEYVKMIVNL